MSNLNRVVVKLDNYGKVTVVKFSTGYQVFFLNHEKNAPSWNYAGNPRNKATFIGLPEYFYQTHTPVLCILPVDNGLENIFSERLITMFCRFVDKNFLCNQPGKIELSNSIIMDPQRLELVDTIPTEDEGVKFIFLAALSTYHTIPFTKEYLHEAFLNFQNNERKLLNTMTMKELPSILHPNFPSLEIFPNQESFLLELFSQSEKQTWKEFTTQPLTYPHQHLKKPPEFIRTSNMEQLISYLTQQLEGTHLETKSKLSKTNILYLARQTSWFRLVDKRTISLTIKEFFKKAPAFGTPGSDLINNYIHLNAEKEEEFYEQFFPHQIVTDYFQSRIIPFLIRFDLPQLLELRELLPDYSWNADMMARTVSSEFLDFLEQLLKLNLPWEIVKELTGFDTRKIGLP